MTTYAQRHPERVDSMVLSGAVPLDRDPFNRSAARATRHALRLVCEHSQGTCDPDRAGAGASGPGLQSTSSQPGLLVQVSVGLP